MNELKMQIKSLDETYGVTISDIKAQIDEEMKKNTETKETLVRETTGLK